MNITFIPSSYYPTIGGLEETIKNLANLFISKGHKVNIITVKRLRNQKPYEVIENTPVDRLPFLYGCPKLQSSSLGFYIRVVALLPYIYYRLWSLLKKYAPDVINIQYVGPHSFYLLPLIRLFRFKMVCSLQAFSLVHLPLAPKYAHFLFKHMLLKAAFVTGCSLNILQDARRRVPEISSKSIVIPNGVLLDEFVLKEKYKHSKRYIFSLGRLSREKGFEVLLMAFAKVLMDKFDIDLIIAGGGMPRSWLERLSKLLKLDNRVIFYGPASRSEVVKLLNGCEFLVVPSRREPFGIVNLEAMAAGKAVIASKVDGIPEIVKDGVNGILVTPNNLDALAEKIELLLRDKELARKLGTNGLEAAKKYQWKDIADKYEQLFQKLIR